MHANQREELSEIKVGGIGAAVGLKESVTGDTLCDENNPIIFENIQFPEPVISLSIEPKTKADREKLGGALKKLQEEDPTFTLKYDSETGQSLISGMGELHLEIKVDRLKREFNVDANVGKPQVAYRETIKNKVEDQEGKYIRQSGGRGQYGHVVLELVPKARGEGREFIDAVKGGAIPKNFIPAAEKGVIEALDNGVLAGYPVTDIEVSLTDGSWHEVDSSEIAFKLAAEIAVKEGIRRAIPVLLEPIMSLEVVVPEEFMGTIIGDLSSKRGQVTDTELRGNTRIIKAVIPLAEMFGYATTMRSQTQGRGTFSMVPSHYQEVPVNIVESIIKK
ncbi:MAG: Elongation factor G [candidate division CPR1 bacterium GW2011_GWA2_42_17]|uniref:Elongation factor G n=1 Tax=candidate division CPR1 bacterium GW2011_GWA2_42_17 TaxID=1618341 RepID=A0A0G1C2P7_9BACT|nr:MAG: Elongation factor G [candidate division CPR1 bacterium GW2011_GWA2_42_17]